MNIDTIKNQVNQYENKNYNILLDFYNESLRKEHTPSRFITVTYQCRTTFIICCN